MKALRTIANRPAACFSQAAELRARPLSQPAANGDLLALSALLTFLLLPV